MLLGYDMKPKKSKILPTGKLDNNLLKEIFKEYNSPQMAKKLENSSFRDNYKDSDKRVKLGFAIGEDAAVITMQNSNKCIVAKTDPITFATEDIGYYVVNVNANDIAAMGATPKWFQATILLPAGTATEVLVKKICTDIQKACLDLGIVLIGGHTEVTYGLNRPIVIGSMIGEVSENQYVQSSGGKPGDAIILTKGIPLEGTSIIAREKENELLEHGISQDVINKAKNLLYTPGISVVKEAMLDVKHFSVHAMHDPTEGGLAGALSEVASASGNGIRIYYERVMISKETRRLCDLFAIDPLTLISSGALIITTNISEVPTLLQALTDAGIPSADIGEMLKDSIARELIMPDGIVKVLQKPSQDALWTALKRKKTRK